MARALVVLATREPDLAVRTQLACTARRLPPAASLPLVSALAQRDEDDTDSRQPLLLWWAIEAHAESDPEAVLKLWQDGSFWRRPLVEHHLIERMSRRWAQAGTQRDLLNCARLFELSPSPTQSRRLASGLEQAAKGRALSGLPEALRRAMARHGVGSSAFALRQGDPAATAEALKTVADETASRAERLEFLAVLAEVRVPGAVPALSRACRGIVKDDALRQAALTALAPYDDPSIAPVVLSVYPALGPLSLPTAQALLASRPTWSMAYVQAIARKPSGWAAPPITAQSIPASIVRKIKQHRDGALQTLAESVWPQTGKVTSAELEGQIRERAAWIRAEVGDPYAGRSLFQTSCSGCHRLFAQGGEVGPDLTVHDRTDIESLLLAILNPSAEIREGYENHTVETRDGRSLAGFLVEQTPQSIVLRGLDNQNVVLARSEIAELNPAGLSLMPEGLLDGWKPQQVRDLFAYLRSTQPLVGEPPQLKKTQP
jgi:putative heme-binding domain-containing protein